VHRVPLAGLEPDALAAPDFVDKEDELAFA
jgi:hypothetical protein